jgi:hypothetical protein
LTIQLIATSNALDIPKFFNGLEGVNEIKTPDGFYKYYYGEYTSIRNAKKDLTFIKKMGFEDAFIRNIYLLMSH